MPETSSYCQNLRVRTIDLVTGSSTTQVLKIYTNNGSGVFSASTTISSLNNADYMAASDLNGDGLSDLFTSLVGSSEETIWINASSGTTTIAIVRIGAMPRNAPLPKASGPLPNIARSPANH